MPKRDKFGRFIKGFKHTEAWKVYISNLLKGRVFTKEHCEKIGLAQVGNKRGWKGGKPLCSNCGKKLSTYIAKKCSHCSKEGKFEGEENPNWRGGVSRRPYPFIFNEQLKERIRVRDNFTCQLCGTPEVECYRRLDVHHIDYDKDNCEENNLMLLCTRCNTKVNFKREYWEKVFRKKMEVKNARVW